MNLHHLLAAGIAALLAVSASARNDNTTAHAVAAPESWVIGAKNVDALDTYYGICLGNGELGILPSRVPLEIEQVVLNGIYDSKRGLSVAVQGVNPFNLDILIGGVSVKTTGKNVDQTIDMRRAVHSTVFEVPQKARISYDIRALRQMPYVGAIAYRIEALEDIDITLAPYITIPEKLYSKELSDQKTEHKDVEGIQCWMQRKQVKTANRGITICAAQMICQKNGEPVQEHFSIKKGGTKEFYLYGSIINDQEFIDPWNESDREAIFCAIEGIDRLVDKHEECWDELWEGDVIIEGDELAQRTAHEALYHLYSFARKGNAKSIPPFGLSATGYNGHIFWDTEIWMYPPMLYLNSGIAQSMMDYRADRIDAARKKASSYGYKGAMFPWESDGLGEESCPTWALTGTSEHHITADIGIAVWNYYNMFRDKQWLRDQGWPLLSSVADFWASRAERNPDGSYSIRKVVGADEYTGIVDDNAFTNGSAIVALRDACKAAKVLGLKAGPEWSEVADNIRIVRNADGVTMDYEGYKGQKTKQADPNLLAYPLGLITDPESIKKDLEYYEGRIDKYGPAMSFAILALQYSRLGNGDKAFELFSRSYKENRLAPFEVLAEGADGDNPYFTTGAGGVLQCLINGFCGLDLTDKGLVQVKSALPSHWKSITVTGVGPEKKTFTNSKH